MITYKSFEDALKKNETDRPRINQLLFIKQLAVLLDYYEEDLTLLQEFDDHTMSATFYKNPKQLVIRISWNKLESFSITDMEEYEILYGLIIDNGDCYVHDFLIDEYHKPE